MDQVKKSCFIFQGTPKDPDMISLINFPLEDLTFWSEKDLGTGGELHLDWIYHEGINAEVRGVRNRPVTSCAVGDDLRNTYDPY